MGGKTGIEWTDATWNPVTGCDKVSPGCDHCYAETLAHRFDGTPQFPNGFAVTLRPERLELPMRWKRPRRVFVNSMSDLFHDQVPDQFIAGVFAVMARTPQHTFQILTKRHGRMRSLLNEHDFSHRVIGPDDIAWPLPNVWLGISAENQRWADIRIPALIETPAAERFVSAEPLLGPIDMSCWLQFGGVSWVIVGGESGRGARPMHPRWARSLRDQCAAAGVPFLFKQWGEWAPAPWKVLRDPDEFTLDYKRRAEAEGASHAFTGGMYTDQTGAWVENFMEMSHQPWSCERAPEAPPAAEGMRKWGKKAAGRTLDGQTWDQYPETVIHA